MANHMLTPLPHTQRSPNSLHGGAAAPFFGGDRFSGVWLFLIILLITAWRITQLYFADIPLFFDESQYWLWAQDLAFGYYSKPPIVAWAIAATTGVFGDQEWAVKLASPLVIAATSWGVGSLASAVFGTHTRILAGTLFLTLPGIAYAAGIIATDPFLMFFWVYALLCVYKAVHTGERRWFIGLGIAAGAGMMAKFAMIYLALGIAVYCFSSRRARLALLNRDLLLAALIALILYAPNIWWNAAHGFVSYLHTKDNAHLDGALFHPDKFGAFLGGQFGVFGPVPFVLLLVFGLRRQADERFAFLLSFSVPIIALMCVQAFLSRANANWAAVAYVSGAVACAGWAFHRPYVKKLLWGSIALHLILAAAFYNFQTIYDTFDIPLSKKNDPMKRLRGWPEAIEMVDMIYRSYDNVTIASDERKILAQAMYYMRPYAFDAVKWNTQGEITDHYALISDLNDHIGEDILIVSRAETPAGYRNYFDSITILPEASYSPYPGYTFTLRMFLGHDFKGYGAKQLEPSSP
jgi:hypothetical protein